LNDDALIDMQAKGQQPIELQNASDKPELTKLELNQPSLSIRL
jgi:hypothetical protein